MELEQVWSLHRSEKPTNTVRSREVPPVKTLKEVLEEAKEEYEKLPQHVKDIMERNSQLRKLADEIE